MKRRKYFFILSVILFWSFRAHAQFDVKLYITEGIVDAAVKSAIENNSSLLLSEMGKAFVEDRTPDFTGISISPEASKTILDIWNNTSVMNCNVSELNRKCLKRYNGGGYQVRKIPLLMADAASEDQRQDIVINYTDTGSIDDIYIYDREIYSISGVLGEGAEVKELLRRESIQDFVNQLITAYNAKNLNFLNMVYSDNALIITGKYITVIPGDAAVKVPEKRVEYTTQTKAQYMQKMKYIFASVKYIKLNYTDIEVQQHPKYPEIYGVTFKQDWYTKYPNGYEYEDKGYVFLMMDFKDEYNPIIHVRTWQPDKYNGEDLPKSDRFGVTSFNLNNR
jgi:hypothetical protein